MLLKQQVGILTTKEQEAFKKDTDIDRKLKLLKELEVDVVELKRKNRELQHEKRELVIKLDAAESRVATLSSTTEVMFFKCILRGVWIYVLELSIVYDVRTTKTASEDPNI